MGSNRNRTAGQGWERKLVKIFRSLGFPHVVTTRSESKARDDAKVDLMNKDEKKNGQFVFNVQAKNTVAHIRYAQLLSEMPKEAGVINVVIHKQTKKIKDRFIPTGEFAILNLNDFLTLINLFTKEKTLTIDSIKFYDSITALVQSPTRRNAESILRKSRKIFSRRIQQ